MACPGWGTRFSARIERGCRSFPIRILIGEENGILFLLLVFFPSISTVNVEALDSTCVVYKLSVLACWNVDATLTWIE